MRINLDHVLAAILFLGEAFFASSLIIGHWQKYASNKAMPAV